MISRTFLEVWSVEPQQQRSQSVPPSFESRIINMSANGIIGSVRIGDAERGRDTVGITSCSTSANSNLDLDVISISFPDYIEMISLDSDASDILPESVTLSGSGRDLDQSATSDSLTASSGDVEMGLHEGGATGA